MNFVVKQGELINITKPCDTKHDETMQLSTNESQNMWTLTSKKGVYAETILDTYQQDHQSYGENQETDILKNSVLTISVDFIGKDNPNCEPQTNFSSRDISDRYISRETWSDRLQYEIKTAKQMLQNLLDDSNYVIPYPDYTFNFQSKNAVDSTIVAKDIERSKDPTQTCTPFPRSKELLQEKATIEKCRMQAKDPVSKTARRMYREHHLVVEDNDVGNDVNVVTISKPLQCYSLSPLQQEYAYHRSELFKKSLLDEDQSIASDRRHQNAKFFHRQRIDDGQQRNLLLKPLSDLSLLPQSSSMQETPESGEKKTSDDECSSQRCRIESEIPPLVLSSYTRETGIDSNNVDPEVRECISATESEVASLDGLPSNLQGLLQRLGKSPRERVLQSLDGIFSRPSLRKQDTFGEIKPRFAIDETAYQSSSTSSISNRKVINEAELQHVNSIDDGQNNDATTCGGMLFDSCLKFSGLWSSVITENDRLKCGSKGHWDTSKMKQQLEVPLAILDCSNIINQENRTSAPRVHSSFVRVARDDMIPSYAETIFSTEADPRMQDWIANQYISRHQPSRDASYQLGQSRTVIVHEIFRGNWTWCTAWSPDGSFLAVATDNHNLAVVDTTSSTVWRVWHDEKRKSTTDHNTARSIRSIAWGNNYIAIGGTGNVVSILSPMEPFEILHNISATGFVGCLHWRCDSNVLAIGSRLDTLTIVRIRDTEDNSTLRSAKELDSDILHKIEYKYWINCVKFSTDGSYIAVGDGGGIVSVYDYEESLEGVETRLITWFKRKDSILSVEWSSDGMWLYAGGEDCSVSVVDTTNWEIVHRIGHDRWVQCIASSYGGSHVAVGGVSSEISILDVGNGWDSVMGVELKGLVPLSAQWHPRDQYLALTGQNNSILVVETTNARHVKGHHLHSISPVTSIEFSPDGRMAIVGNEAGVVTFFSLSGTTFITAYELVTPFSKSMCIRWSLSGMFIVVASTNNVIVISRMKSKRHGLNCPPNASGFSVKKILSDVGVTHSISIDMQSQYVAISGKSTKILDARDDFATVQEWKNGPFYANAWSPDGRWLAMMGKAQRLTIYDTSSKHVDRWKAIFSMQCDFIGLALAWGPIIVGGLLYLAYGGDSNEIFIMEIRTYEGTWETVLKVRRDATINALEWSMDGLLAAGIGNGTVCIVDLAYLQSGVTVNEMDYNWQRQALTCFTEIRRNRGINSIKALRWLPAAPGSDRLLAIAGTDGEIEIIDLTERHRCKGYTR